MLFPRRSNFQEGLPNLKQFDSQLHMLLILDDLMAVAYELVVNMFTKISHHRNVSIFFLTQNVFHESKL